MKIAVVTDDEITVSQHFGRAEYYMVFNIENGKIIGKEKRSKLGHKPFAFKDERPHVHSEQHGYDITSIDRHMSMASEIKDCLVLIAGGMGKAAYTHMQRFKIEPVVTDITDIDEAIRLYIEGKLPNLNNRLD